MSSPRTALGQGRERLKVVVLETGLWLLAILVLGLYARPWAPIWLDELFHFAMGGMTWEYALRTIDYTTIEINHGQTGTYMFLDWILMQVFGANAFALRLPSLFAAAILVAASVTFIRRRGFGYGWQYVTILGLAVSSPLMMFTSQARPYMPIAAASVALLAFYQYVPGTRLRPWPLLLGLSSVCGGALFHPYFLLMLVLLVPYCAWLALVDGKVERSVRALLRFTNPALLGVGCLIFFILGRLTWMRRVLEFGFGPLDMMGNSWANVLKFAVLNHFANRSTSMLWVVGFGLFTLVILIIVGSDMSSRVIPPILLLGVGLAFSITVSALSAYRQYWILERQWVVGIALSSLAVTWLFAEVLRSARERSLVIAAIPSLVFVVLIVLSSGSALSSQRELVAQDRVKHATFVSETRTQEELRPVPPDDDGIIYAANVNAVRGGPVWVMFIDWYDGLSGMRPEFRETNPSWSGFLGKSRVQED